MKQRFVGDSQFNDGPVFIGTFAEAQADLAKLRMTLTDQGESPHDGTRHEVWKDGVRIESYGDLDNTSLIIARHRPKNTGSPKPGGQGAS